MEAHKWRSSQSERSTICEAHKRSTIANATLYKVIEQNFERFLDLLTIIYCFIRLLNREVSVKHSLCLLASATELIFLIEWFLIFYAKHSGFLQRNFRGISPAFTAPQAHKGHCTGRIIKTISKPDPFGPKRPEYQSLQLIDLSPWNYFGEKFWLKTANQRSFGQQI